MKLLLPRSKSGHVRNLTLASLFIIAVMLVSIWQVPVQAQAQANLTVQNSPLSVQPGGIAQFVFQLQNNTGEAQTFNITQTGLPAGFVVAVPGSIIVNANATVNFNVNVSVDTDQDPGTYTGLLTANAGGGISAQAFFQVIVLGDPATPTPQPTATPAPPPTPGPACPADPLDPGGDPAGARLLLVNLPENHGICVIGEEDWFQFGAVGGKVYTIDVTAMDAGIDLVIELYDPDLNLITVNDDFFARTPTPPDPFDLRPRVQSFTAPRDGLYFIRVRDSIGLGGRGDGVGNYTIVVRGESYGPTPVLIPELCRDLYEEDGLPEQAALITSNEIQRNRALCPAGDADWVRFFAAAGKTYVLYTDTRPYTAEPEFNQGAQTGADTTLLLVDRDGVTPLAFNDDIPGSLDSEIRFTPTVDGFYFAQVKNVGDIGNQFIRYDLALVLCLPGQEDQCGRAPEPLPAEPFVPAPGANTTPTPEDDFDDDLFEFELTATAESLTATAEATPDDFAFSLNVRDGQMINGQVNGFADSGFARVWQRSDRPVAEQRVARSWVWGPRGLMARTENYAQVASGMRQVEYFDKARMEVNNPNGDRASNWFVTTGLLVVELITGRMQVGDNEFVARSPANVPVAGDPTDRNAPTYASFANLIAEPARDRSGQIIAEALSRDGRIGAYSGPQRNETRLMRFVPETGHNIPQVFWEYLNTSGTVYENGGYRNGTLVDWVFTMGYPISEPYWTSVQVGGVQRDVLVQVFERRVLTYTPENPAGWQVEMGNVGRHYYVWRYGEELPQ